MTKAVPKPKKEGPCTVTCGACGTTGYYTLQQMTSHQKWCKPAKDKKDKEAKGKLAKANRSPHHR